MRRWWRQGKKIESSNRKPHIRIQYDWHTYTRVKAYGEKWYTWFSKQRYRINAKKVPRKYRDK